MDLGERIQRFMISFKKRPMRFMCRQLESASHETYFIRAENYEAVWHWQITAGLMSEYRGFKHQDIID